MLLSPAEVIRRLLRSPSDLTTVEKVLPNQPSFQIFHSVLHFFVNRWLRINSRS